MALKLIPRDKCPGKIETALPAPRIYCQKINKSVNMVLTSFHYKEINTQQDNTDSLCKYFPFQNCSNPNLPLCTVVEYNYSGIKGEYATDQKEE